MNFDQFMLLIMVLVVVGAWTMAGGAAIAVLASVREWRITGIVMMVATLATFAAFRWTLLSRMTDDTRPTKAVIRRNGRLVAS